MEENNNRDSIKEALKKRIKEKLKKELLDEIYSELKLEENELAEELSSTLTKEKPQIDTIAKEIKPIEKIKSKKSILITIKSILKIASHSLKYAHSKIPRDQWVEVIGLLAGKLDDEEQTLLIEDAYPMGHGTAIHAEIKDYKNFVRAFQDIKEKNLFICGYYHSHPSYGTFMSTEDIDTQSRYQKLWEKAIALVIDPYQIDGTSLGFEIYRADIKSQKWYKIPFSVKGSLDVKMLPDILEFMNPIIEGKAAYLEYDEK